MSVLGQTAYEESIRGYPDRLEWHQLRAWVQAYWARVELASRKAEASDRERRWRDIAKAAEDGATSPTQLWSRK